MIPCLIITSCIYPFSSFVKLTDPEEREILHIKALKRWILESNFESIIICDNSNYSYSDDFVILAKSQGKCLEVLSFEGDKIKSEQYGKGYGEGEIMKYVLNNSSIISNYESFCKVTGKLFIKNSNKYLGFKNIDFAFDFSYNFFWNKEKVDCVYTNFYYANISMFKLFLEQEYLNVSDSEGVYLEHVYASALNEEVDIKVTPILPIISGVSGSSGSSYTYQRMWLIFVKYLLLSTPLIRKFN
jgi:hypothetical protein